MEPGELLRGEAEAMMAGLMLDTKNFTMRTGGRTFEAAAFLRRAGAETSEVRRYFQSDLPSMIQRYDIIREAKLYHGDIAIAVVTKEVPRVTAAKAADDLLTLQGVQASIVLYRAGEGTSMSGRSLGEINVQVILERLGGGGNSTTAGGHVPGSEPETVYQDFLRYVNPLLRQCGMMPFYLENPYERLLAYLMQTDTPVDSLRNMWKIVNARKGDENDESVGKNTAP